MCPGKQKPAQMSHKENCVGPTGLEQMALGQKKLKEIGPEQMGFGQVSPKPKCFKK